MRGRPGRGGDAASGRSQAPSARFVAPRGLPAWILFRMELDDRSGTAPVLPVCNRHRLLPRDDWCRPEGSNPDIPGFSRAP